MIDFIITRHAISCNNAKKGLFFGRDRSPSLTGLGMDQTLHLSQKKPNVYGYTSNIIVSPLIRTWQTAFLLYGMRQKKIKLYIFPHLREKGYNIGKIKIDSYGNKPNIFERDILLFERFVRYVRKKLVNFNCQIVEFYYLDMNSKNFNLLCSMEVSKSYKLVKENVRLWNRQRLYPSYLKGDIDMFLKYVKDVVTNKNKVHAIAHSRLMSSWADKNVENFVKPSTNLWSINVESNKIKVFTPFEPSINVTPIFGDTFDLCGTI